MALTIYHNPRCSKSRQTLQLVADSGVEHNIVQYLQDSPDAATILDIAAKLNIAVAGLLRRGERDFQDADDLPALDDDAALATWVAAHPIVMERPVVVDNESGKAILGRPPENVEELLR